MRYVSAAGSPRPIGDADFRALAGFRYALRQFLHFSERAATEAGITPRQHQALLALRGWDGPEPMTVGDLAEQLQVRHHSAVGLVQRLARRGLLTRRPLARDRRRILLEPTRTGLKLLASLAAAHRDELRRVRPRLETLLESL